MYNASKVIANYLKPLAKNDFIINDTLSFPDMLKKADNSEDYEDGSYDVESLFTNIPVKETIEYILDKIYVDKSIKKVYLCKMEGDVVVPAKPIFYKRYVDDTYIRRKKIYLRKFQNLNCYHTNIKLTLEENPRKFLDTEIIRKNNTISTQVFTKLTKFPFHWISKIPTNYKRNAITSELHRARKIATDFDKELRRIKTKFLHAGYPVKFINNTFFRFSQEKDELLIPKWLFDETELVIIRLPFAPRNEKFSKRFISKLQTFTNGKVRFNIIWNTRKI